MNIEGLKRVLCDSQSENEYDDDDDNVVAPQEKRIKCSESDTTDSSNSAGRSILSFFNRDDLGAVAFSKTTDVETGRSVPRKCSTKSSKSNEKPNARDYSKCRAVCLICVKNENPKLQKKANLSRSGNYQIKKHKNSCHPTIPVDEVKRNIVPFNHASVPKSLRERKSKEQPALHTDGGAKRPEPCDAEPGETTAANNLSVTEQPESGNEDHYSNGEQEGVDHSQLSQNAEYSGSDSIRSPATTMQNTRDFGSGPSCSIESSSSTNNTLQTDLSNFVTIKKQTFEEKVLSMLEKLTNKVDNLKEASSSPAGNIYSFYNFAFISKHCNCFNHCGKTSR